MQPDNKKTQKLWFIVSLVIAVSALTVSIIAATKEEYSISIAMLLVIIWQFYNIKQWKKRNGK